MSKKVKVETKDRFEHFVLWIQEPGRLPKGFHFDPGGGIETPGFFRISYSPNWISRLIGGHPVAKGQVLGDSGIMENLVIEIEVEETYKVLLKSLTRGYHEYNPKAEIRLSIVRDHSM
jgi:hypothetical protein